MQAQDPSPVRLERLDVAQGLRPFQDGERVTRLRNRRLGLIVRREHEGNAGVRPPLVVLPGRVQVPRAKPEGAGRLRTRTDSLANLREGRFDVAFTREVGQERDVIARTDRVECPSNDGR